MVALQNQFRRIGSQAGGGVIVSDKTQFAVTHHVTVNLATIGTLNLNLGTIGIGKEHWALTVAKHERGLSAPSPRMVSAIVQILDIALDHRKADEVIGDLLEQYPRGRALGPGHAKRWLVAQTAWVIFYRALDVIRQVAAARAGSDAV